jgi:protoheme IX farnesyltransferase
MTSPLAYPDTERRVAPVAVRDLVALAKPRITVMVVATTAGGLLLAPLRPSVSVAGLALLGTVLVVAGANALNMYLERDVDARMERTRKRPLPAGRLAPRVALWFGIALSVASIPILAIGVNLTTALLALLAHLIYVLAYTPLKPRSHWALWVGAVPGAMPPLLGWTAATAEVGLGGVVLFGILFLWQIPHFLAISIFRRHEYREAGLLVMPNTDGIRATESMIVWFAFALVVVSLLLVPIGVEGHLYLLAAGALGSIFFGVSCYGRFSADTTRWARSLFFLSIVYLVLLFAALAAGHTGPR